MKMSEVFKLPLRAEIAGDEYGYYVVQNVPPAQVYNADEIVADWQQKVEAEAICLAINSHDTLTQRLEKAEGLLGRTLSLIPTDNDDIEGQELVIEINRLLAEGQKGVE